MMAGIPLSTESIDAAVKGARLHMQRVALEGHTGRGYLGLSNLATTGTESVNRRNSGVVFTAGATTAIQIRDEINDEITAMIAASEEVLGGELTDGLTVYLPTTQFGLLSSRFVGDNQEVTIMKAIKEDNPWKHFAEQYGDTMNADVMFKSFKELEDAGSGTTDRMIVALKNPRIFEMGVSIMPRVLEIINKGRNICAQVEYKFGSLYIKRPIGIRYTDDI